MNIYKLREQLKIDEGVKYCIYLDHKGYKTFGIGHLLTRKDPEFEWIVDTPVSYDRVSEAFEDDLDTVIDDCINVFPYFSRMPEEVQEIMANMMFNLGRPRFKKFKKMIAAVIEEDWHRAASEMYNSNWYHDVGERAQRLMDRMDEV
jgi:lysozyme